MHVEFHVKEPKKVEKFYETLFGWKFQEVPGMDYSLFQAPSGPAGGIGGLQPGNWQPGVINYILVNSVDEHVEKVKKAGGKIVAPSDATPFPNTDFSTFILKAQSLKPQIFGTMQAGADLVNVVKQYNEFGLKKQGIGLAIGLLFESDVAALGQDAYEGATATVPWFWNLDKKATDWTRRFEKEVGHKPSFDQAAVY